MQKLGQHFLKNERVLDAIVDALGIERGDRVIEIGPGHGELTTPLLRTAEKVGDGSLAAIEKDHGLIPALAKLAEGAAPRRLTIIEGDALKLLPGVVRDALAEDNRGDSASYKIAGNIPYYITGKLLRVMSELEQKPSRAVLLIQKEVAERICAAPPEMNRLAASVQFWADAKIVVVVPRKDFSPAPDVDSAIIVLETKKSTAGGAAIDPERYYETVRGIFAQPRKTLLNNISAMGDGESAGDGKKNHAAGDKKEIIASRLKKCGVDPAARPQDLSIPQIIAITKGTPWG